MSSWTYINGTITVSPMGRTQAEKRYILDTVLNHLPIVTGSEKDMSIHVVQKDGFNGSSGCDEFGDQTNNLIDCYGDKDQKSGSLRIQDEYILVVDAGLRDRVFEETFREFNRWLCRLAKRVSVEDMLVEIRGYKQVVILRNNGDAFTDMFEMPSWADKNSHNWCERIMWNN